jgi:biopolymer transport protein ExbD
MARRRKEEDVELMLMPFMNLMTLLIPFLLVSAQFVTLAVIDSSLPAIGAPKTTTDQKDDKPPLNLTVGITGEGFTVAGSASVLGGGTGGPNTVDTEGGPTIGLTSSDSYCRKVQCGEDPACRHDTPCHDYKALQELVIRVKDDYPDEENVIIAPNADIQYHILIAVMDATRDHKPDGAEDREPLFPFVVVAGGAK